MKLSSENTRDTAIVMGASIGGLMTAKVLSKHFKKVIIIEKDEVNRQPESRKGQLHTRHLHGLLPGGLNVMLQYFPDLTQALAEHGANVCDFGDTMVWQTYGGYRQQLTMNLVGVTMSRALLEHLIRERVLSQSNIELMDKTMIKRLETSLDNGTVNGVVIETKGNDTPSVLKANLVVDVTGRNSRSPQWLKEMGFGELPISEVKVNVGYATRIYKRDVNDPLSNKWILHTPDAPNETRFGGVFPIEGERWVMSVGGWHGDKAPLDEAEHLAYVKSLGMPELYKIASTCEPLSEIYAYNFPSSLRKHYEKMKRFPKGYLVLGDAISSFNPTYGQGMTSASLQAIELDKLLTNPISDDTLALTFFKKAAKVIDTPWSLAVGEDFRYAETEGPKPPAINFINKYISRVHRATLKDKVVCEAFLNVMSLLKPPTSLFHPKIVWRVMRA